MRDNESKMPLMQFTLYVSPFNLLLQYSKKKKKKTKKTQSKFYKHKKIYRKNNADCKARHWGGNNIGDSNYLSYGRLSPS